MMVPKFNFETGIALLYLVFAGVWIWLSDFVLAIFITDPAYLTRLQTAKGWIFVLVTTGLLFIILQKYMQRQRQSAAKLSENEERLRMALYCRQSGDVRFEYSNWQGVCQQHLCRDAGLCS
jgi:membrane protein implicated in regulation of membrane protease activity